MTLRLLRRSHSLAVDWAVIEADGTQRCGSAPTRDGALMAALAAAGVRVEELRERVNREEERVEVVK